MYPDCAACWADFQAMDTSSALSLAILIRHRPKSSSRGATCAVWVCLHHCWESASNARFPYLHALPASRAVVLHLSLCTFTHTVASAQNVVCSLYHIPVFCQIWVYMSLLQSCIFLALKQYYSCNVCSHARFCSAPLFFVAITTVGNKYLYSKSPSY